jgi:lysophospholipase L1-like esterase
MIRGCGKFLLLIASVALAVVAVEATLQTRMYLRSGQGLIALLTDRMRYRTDVDSGLKLLNPRASRPEFRINSLGFRSDEVSQAKTDGLVRIAIVGASTVMGELAASNENTFAYLLGRQLNAASPVRRYEVVNAGIAGYRVKDQAQLIDQKIRPLAPDLIVIVPGFNDVSDYCGGSSRDKPVSYAAPMPTLPEWWSSFNTVRRLTSSWRPSPPVSPAAAKREIVYDWAAYRREFDGLLRVASSVAPRVLVATNGRAFGLEQDEATRWRLSSSVRSYATCLSVEGVIQIYDRLNTEIAQSTATQGLLFIDLARLIPKGAEYFGDATHFTPRGEALVSNLLLRKIQEAGVAGGGQ